MRDRRVQSHERWYASQLNRKLLVAALIVAAIVMLLAVAPLFAAESPGSYTISAPAAVDGDTIKGEVVLWRFPRMTISLPVRVSGIDTPELKGNGQRVIPACEKSLAKAAMAFTSQWLDNNQPVTISNIAQDKYGPRVEAIVSGSNGNLLAGALLAAGHARPYNGGARQPWCQ